MGFELPQLRSCCCGCSIRMGTLIILWLYLVYVLVFSSNVIQAKPGSDSHNKTANTTNNGVSFQDLELVVPPALDVCVTLVIVAVVISGLYGTYQNKAVYLLPFVILYVFTPVESIVRIFLISNWTVAAALGCLIYIAICVYLWLVVFSHYRDLKENRSGLMA